MNIEDNDIPFTRGNLIDNLSIIEYHKRTLEMIKVMDEQIECLAKETGGEHTFRNPREETTYLHDVKTLSVLKRQRERLMQKLSELQERIQDDIDASKSVTPLKPLK